MENSQSPNLLSVNFAERLLEYIEDRLNNAEVAEVLSDEIRVQISMAMLLLTTNLVNRVNRLRELSENISSINAADSTTTNNHSTDENRHADSNDNHNSTNEHSHSAAENIESSDDNSLSSDDCSIDMIVDETDYSESDDNS